MEKYYFEPDRAGADALALRLFSERLGEEPKSEAYSRMLSDAEVARSSIYDSIRLAGMYAIYFQEEFSISGCRLYADGSDLECSAFERIAPETVKGVIFHACTAGSLTIAGDDTMEEFYAEMWGGAYLDGLRALMEEELAGRAAEKGLMLSRSFGPGFYGMSLLEMVKFQRVLDFGSLGIRLNPSGVIEPANSCLGIYFIAGEGFEEPGPECESCAGNRGGCRFCRVRKKGRD